MEKLKRSLGSFIVPLLSIILAFVIGGIIMAALGANPFDAVKYLFQGAFGSKANIGTTLTKATPLMFTSLCACFAYKCGVFNLGGEGQFLMGSIAAFVTAYFSGVTGFAGVLLALLAGGILLLGRLGRGGRRRSLLAESRCGTAEGASAAEALGGVSIHAGRHHAEADQKSNEKFLHGRWSLGGGKNQAPGLKPMCMAQMPKVMFFQDTRSKPASVIMPAKVGWSGCMRMDSAR